MLELITPPASEPITLAEAKLHLRVDGSAEDTLIASLITAARQHVEAATGRSLMPTTWRSSFAAFADPLEIPVAPLRSISSVEAYGATGSLATVSPSIYLVTTPSGPQAQRGALHLNAGSYWPDLATRPDAVRVQYVAGYADAASVPGPLKSAILLVLTDLFENRAGAMETTRIGTNPAVDALLNPYRLTWV